MDFLSIAMTWIYAGIATWSGAAIIGGLLILVADRFSRRREPSDIDVRRAATHYRQHYGEQALMVIGDHILAASFAPDGRHKSFLKQVCAELLANRVELLTGSSRRL